MLEREMEDLIAAFPDDFFPRNNFVLRGRQKSFQGVGRFDLLFEDRHGASILMELKAVPACYKDADQLARYSDALRQLGERRVVMWLIAPSISRMVRDFLTDKGIEWSEIHEGEFRRIADLRGVASAEKSPSEACVAEPSPKERTAVQITQPKATSSHSRKAWHFNTDESELAGGTANLLAHSCFALWGYPNTEALLNKPLAGELIMFYKSKCGIVACGYVADEPAMPSNLIFGKRDTYEHRRSVISLISVPDSAAISPAELRELGITSNMGSLCRRYPPSIAEQLRDLLVLRSRSATPTQSSLAAST